MKHLTLGTAGHVDHGKTTLIKALTGFDCDTHSEEKNRGITIHLGFTSLKIDDEHHVGVIDVPGHKDFINTMIAGANGIDFVMLVVAADSGIMPQTEEHLKIIKLLGIKSGFIVLTKTDLVDEETIELAKEEIEEFTLGTFLENCPIIGFSAKDKSGLSEIKAEIINQINMVNERDLGVIFRMYVDRIFTSEGFGTVVNGTVLSGTITKDEPVMILPSKQNVRIRAIQHFKKEIDQLFPGDRASLNIIGMKKERFSRGMLITSEDRESSNMIDCTLENFSSKPIPQWSTVIFLSGTFKSKAKIHLIDTDEIKPDEQALVQLDLDKGGIFYYNDKFVIRDSSNETTLGGGRIIDVFPLKHRKRPQKLIDKLTLLAADDIKNVVLNEISKSINFVESNVLSLTLNITEQKILNVAQKLTDSISIIKKEKHELYIMKEFLENINTEILRIVRRNQLQNSLSDKGLTITDILKYVTYAKDRLDKKIIENILNELINEGKIIKNGNTYLLSSHNPNNNPNLIAVKDQVKNEIDNFGYNIPEDYSKEDIQKKFSLKGQEINSVLNFLIETNQILFYQEMYVSMKVLNDIYDILFASFEGKEFKIADFRDILGTNRKTALFFLEIFDKNSITVRNNDTRTLTGKTLRK